MVWHTTHVLFFCLVGCTLIFVGILLGHWPSEQSGQEAANAADASHTLEWWGLVILLVKELGVAAIVASIVGGVFDAQARREEKFRAQQWEAEQAKLSESFRDREAERSAELRRKVAEDATFALFGLTHDRAFVKAVIETNLLADVVRVDLIQDYKLRNLSQNEAMTIDATCPDEASSRFVMLDMEQRFKFRNVTSRPIDHRIRIGVPRRAGSGISNLTKATYVKLGSEEPLTEQSIADAIDLSCSNEDYLEYAWNREIAPGGEISVVANVACVKERSDNEVWGSFFPTMGGAQLSLEVLDGMHWGLRELTNGTKSIKADVIPKANKTTWIISGPLLRHNSAVFWWRTKADSGEALCIGDSDSTHKDDGLSPTAAADPKNRAG